MKRSIVERDNDRYSDTSSQRMGTFGNPDGKSEDFNVEAARRRNRERSFTIHLMPDFVPRPTIAKSKRSQIQSSGNSAK